LSEQFDANTLKNSDFKSAFSDLLEHGFDGYSDPRTGSWFADVLRLLGDSSDKNPLTAIDQRLLNEEGLKAQAALAAGQTKDIETAVYEGSKKSDRDSDKTFKIEGADGNIYNLNEIKNSVSFLKSASADAFSALVSIKKAARAGIDAVNKIAEPHRQALASIKESYGGVTMMGSKAANDMGTTLQNSYKQFASDYMKTNSELREANRDLLVLDDEFLDAAPEAFKKLGDQVNFMMTVYEDPKNAFKTYLDVVNKTARTYGSEIAKNFEKHAVEVDLIGKGLGLSSQQLQKVITRNIDRTGNANIETLKQFNQFAQGVADATGKSSKIVADTMAAVISDVQNFGNVTDEEASRISGALLDIGIAADTLGKLVGKFANFDQAASAVGNLTAAFGLNLDAMEMMMLANEDQEQFLFRMRDAFEEQGVNFQDMSLAQQKLISSQIGLTIEESARFFDFDNQITSIDELKEATDDLSPDEAVRKLKSEILSLVDKGGPALETAIKNTKAFGLGGEFLDDVMAVQRNLAKVDVLMGQIEAKAQAEISSKIIDNVNAAGEKADEIIKKLNANLKKAKEKIDTEKATQQVELASNEVVITEESASKAGDIIANKVGEMSVTVNVSEIENAAGIVSMQGEN
jgi:hypothetical protein